MLGKYSRIGSDAISSVAKAPESDAYMVGDMLMLTVNKGTISISPGLMHVRSYKAETENDGTATGQNLESVIRMTRSGVIKAHTNTHDPSQKSLRLEFICKRYIPMQGDHVIGIVHGRVNDYYTVDINSQSLAFLPQLAFDGVTNRNKPNLTSGDLLFCRVSLANPDSHPEITCVDKKTNKANGMGVLGGSVTYGRRGATNSGVLLT